MLGGDMCCQLVLFGYLKPRKVRLGDWQVVSFYRAEVDIWQEHDAATRSREIINLLFSLICTLT